MIRKLLLLLLLAVVLFLAAGCAGIEVGPGGIEAGVGIGPFKALKVE